MPRGCSICLHPDREAIDRALVSGQSVRATAAVYNVSARALHRHHDEHIPESLLKAKAAEDMTRADNLLSHLTALYQETTELSQAAKKAGDIRAGFMGIRERKGILELLLELAGRLDRKPTLNLNVHPEWILIRATLVSALSPYPDAAAAVAETLLTLEAPKADGANGANGLSDQPH